MHKPRRKHAPKHAASGFRPVRRLASPVFALDALLVLLATKREFDAATATQLAELAADR